MKKRNAIRVGGVRTKNYFSVWYRSAHVTLLNSYRIACEVITSTMRPCLSQEIYDVFLRFVNVEHGVSTVNKVLVLCLCCLLRPGLEQTYVVLCSDVVVVLAYIIAHTGRASLMLLAAG